MDARITDDVHFIFRVSLSIRAQCHETESLLAECRKSFEQRNVDSETTTVYILRQTKPTTEYTVTPRSDMPKDSHLGVDGDELRLGLELELELPHPDEVLVYLGEALLTSVLQVFREELQLSRHSLQGLGVVSRQLAASVARAHMLARSRATRTTDTTARQRQ